MSTTLTIIIEEGRNYKDARPYEIIREGGGLLNLVPVSPRRVKKPGKKGWETRPLSELASSHGDLPRNG